MSTIIDYTTLKENANLHYILCYLVELLWEGIGILEDDDFDEKAFAMNPYAMKIDMKKEYIWKWLRRNHPEQEIIITANDRTSTFNTNNCHMILSGVPFDKVDVNKPLEEWVYNL